MKTFLILGAILFAFTAQADKTKQHGMGNGGDAVVCYTDVTRSVISSVRMFDYWEQEQVLKYGPIDLGASTLSVQEKIEVATNRIAKFDPTLADQIKKSALRLADNIKNYLVTSYILPDIDDATPQVIPSQPNCYIEQYGIQFKEVITGQRRFAISDKFYNHVNTTNDQRAGLLLHEAIYRYAILMEPLLANSDGIRIFNYVIATNKLNNTDYAHVDDYVNILKTSGIYDRSCIHAYSGTYVRDISTHYNPHYKLCYSSKVSLGQQIQFKVLSGAYISYIQDSAGQLIYISYSSAKVYRNTTVSQTEYDTAWIRIDFTQSQLEMLQVKNINPTVEFKIHGPLNKFYTCQYSKGSPYDVSFNFNTGEVHKCSVNEVTPDYSIYNLEKMSSDQWRMKASGKFEILGSRNNLKMELDNHGSDDPDILIDENMKLQQGTIKENTVLNINGRDEIVSFIKVHNSGGVHTLEFTSPFSSMYAKYPEFKIQGLRLIDSSPKQDNSFVYCNQFGRDGDHYNRSKTEYVDYEQFYDLASQKIVFKTDESVGIVEVIYCLRKTFTTQFY